MKRFLTLLLFCSLVLVGCSSRPHTILGTWTVEKPGSPGNNVTYVFNKDGTYSFLLHATVQSIHTHQSATGTYKFAANTLTLFTNNEIMGIDADAMAAIDEREKKLDPHLHITQDKGDVPVRIEQPETSFHVTFDGDKVKLKDLTNYADHGVVYVRPARA